MPAWFLRVVGVVVHEGVRATANVVLRPTSHATNVALTRPLTAVTIAIDPAASYAATRFGQMMESVWKLNGNTHSIIAVTALLLTSCGASPTVPSNPTPPAQVVALRLEGGTVLVPSGTIQMRAIGITASGEQLPLTTGVGWTADGAVAAVSAGGLLQAKSVGTTTATATYASGVRRFTIPFPVIVSKRGGGADTYVGKWRGTSTVVEYAYLGGTSPSACATGYVHPFAITFSTNGGDVVSVLEVYGRPNTGTLTGFVAENTELLASGHVTIESTGKVLNVYVARFARSGSTLTGTLTFDVSWTNSFGQIIQREVHQVAADPSGS